VQVPLWQRCAVSCPDAHEAAAPQAVPFETLEQVPVLQVWHSPVQALSQQTPREHAPLAQAAPVPHGWPLASACAHRLFWQVAPGAHSVFPVHVVLQAPPLQA